MGAGASKSDAHVVVIGGNFAGVGAAQELEKKGFRVTVLEPRDALYINFAGLRTLTEENWEDRCFVPYDKVFKKPGNVFLRGLATGVDSTARTVTYRPVGADGRVQEATVTLPFDFLVIATGSTYGQPMNIAGGSFNTGDASRALAPLRAAVRAAKQVVIVGGGPTGIELAGEIATDVKGTLVTLLHGDASLISSAANGGAFPAKFTAKIHSILTGKGVQVRLGERVTATPAAPPAGAVAVAPNIFAAAPGATFTVATSTAPGGIPADLLIFATGGRPATSWITPESAPALAAQKDAAGYIKVDRAYAVAGVEGIFALGDVAASGDMKAGWVIGSSAPIVAANIATLAAAKASRAKTAPKLKEGKAGGYTGMMLVPVGRDSGAGLTPLGMLGPGMVSSIKGKTLFTDMQAGRMGWKIPALIQRNAALRAAAPVAVAAVPAAAGGSGA